MGLDPQTASDYRLAKHLIDVRGRCEEGANLLLKLVDKPEVIAVPGQASWMLAHAARALTLAGKTEEAALYIPGARNGGRGTAFEPYIEDLLASFAPQGAGLDPDFLDYVKRQLRASDGLLNLFEAYGHDLTPYLRFIVGNEQGDYSLTERQRALNLLFTVLDAPSADGLVEQLLSEGPLEMKGLMQVFQDGNAGETRFRDSESRNLGADVVIRLAQETPQELKDLALDALINMYGWTVYGEGHKVDDPVALKISGAALELLEAGYRGDKNIALELIATQQRGAEDSTGSLAEHVGNSKDAALADEMRWTLARRKLGRDLTRKWAMQGEPIDQLRLALMSNREIGDIILNPTLPSHVDTIAWLENLEFQGQPAIEVLEMRRNHRADSEDYKVLASMTSSNEPLVKYLAASTLLRQRLLGDVVALLQDPTDQPEWASLIFAKWLEVNQEGYDIPEELLEPLLAMATSGPLQDDARALLNHRGKNVITVGIWRELGLNPGRKVSLEATIRAFEENGDGNAANDLAWVMTNNDANHACINYASDKLSRSWPRTYLENVDKLDALGRRWAFFGHEQNAWQTIIKEEGIPVLQEFEAAAEAAIFHGKGGEWSFEMVRFVGDLDADMAIRILLRNMEGNEEFLLWVFEQAQLGSYMYGVKDKQAATELVLGMLDMGVLRPFERPETNVFKQLIDPTLDSYPQVLTKFWQLAQERQSGPLLRFLIEESVQAPALREKFEIEIRAHLSLPRWTNAVIDACLKEGKLQWVFDDMLAILEGDPSSDLRHDLLISFGSIDDERADQVLLNHVNDPRPKIRDAAASSLRQIKQRRSEQAMWESWGEEDEQSATSALLKNLKDPDLEIRLVSIESLGTLGDKDALPALINLLRDENQQIKDAARKALDRINLVESEQTMKVELSKRLIELEDELAALREKFADSHPEVVSTLSKIEATKARLQELEGN